MITCSITVKDKNCKSFPRNFLGTFLGTGPHTIARNLTDSVQGKKAFQNALEGLAPELFVFLAFTIAAFTIATSTGNLYYL